MAEGQVGIKQLMNLLMNMNPAALSGMLEKTGLNEQEKKNIRDIFEQFSQDRELNSENKQKALLMLQQLLNK